MDVGIFYQGHNLNKFPCTSRLNVCAEIQMIAALT